MIYCICNNINTAAVDRAAGGGAKTAASVQRACGGKFNCGQCRADIAARLETLGVTRPCADRLSAPVLESPALESPVFEAAE